MRRHRHAWIFARRTFAGSLFVCSLGSCPARRYVADLTTQEAKPRPVASAEAS